MSFLLKWASRMSVLRGITVLKTLSVYVWRKTWSEVFVFTVGSLIVKRKPRSFSPELKNFRTSAIVFVIWTMLSSSKYPGDTTTIIASDAVNELMVNHESAGGQSMNT